MRLTSGLENDANNKAVNTQDTGHNNGNERLEDQLRLEDTDGGNTNTGLGGTVSGSQVAEDEGSSDAHEPKEGVLVRIVNYRSRIGLELHNIDKIDGNLPQRGVSGYLR
jgi:hypothetical protein